MSTYWHVADATSASALGTGWYDESGVLNTRNDLQMAARGLQPSEQIFIRSSGPSRRGPRNLPWAVLCLENRGHLALPGSKNAAVSTLLMVVLTERGPCGGIMLCGVSSGHTQQEVGCCAES